MLEEIEARFYIDSMTADTIESLARAGYSHVGTTTYRGRLMELDFFNQQHVHINISFRHMPEDQQPLRMERGEGAS